MPHPAIIFVGLCVLVIVLSAILAAFDVSVTYDVAEQPPVVAEQEYVGGSVVPEPEISPEQYLDDEIEIVQETTEIESLLSADGIRFLFSSFVNNFASFSVVAVVFVAMIGVGVAEEAGLMAALIRKLVKVGAAGDARVHHRVRRRPLERRHRRRLPDPHPARRGGVPAASAATRSPAWPPPTPASARLRRQRPDHPARQPAHRGHQRGDRPRRPEPVDRPHRQPLVRHRLDVLRAPSSSRSSSSGSPSRRSARTCPDADIDAAGGGGARGRGRAACASPPTACSPRWLGVVLLTVLPDAPLRNPETGVDLRQLAADGQPDLHHHDAVPGRRHLLRDRGQDDHQQRRRDQRHHQDVRRPRRPDLPAAADQPVHRLLQLQQHARRSSR